MLPQIPKFKTPQEVIDFAKQHVNSTHIPNITATALLSLSGPNGGDWLMQVTPGKLQVSNGTVANPQLSMKMASSDFLALANREGNPMALFMQGKIQVTGDMALAMQLQQILFNR